jgi:hypothetical protein
MQELEKVLEEINDRFENLTIADDECRKTALSKHNYEQVKYFQNAMFYTERAKGIVEEIIHKHMGNDGWIPVEERLPDNRRSNYEVTFINECGYEEHGFSQWYDGEFHIPAVVIAWREHLKPYRPERGEEE